MLGSRAYVPSGAVKGRRQKPPSVCAKRTARRLAEGRTEGRRGRANGGRGRWRRGEAVVDEMGTLAYLKFAFWWPIFAASASPTIAVTVRCNTMAYSRIRSSFLHEGQGPNLALRGPGKGVPPPPTPLGLSTLALRGPQLVAGGLLTMVQTWT